jgi:cellulose synthase/poly-beta-1,6-N-acetylglucosamine synthase-like glycosyltransferase
MLDLLIQGYLFVVVLFFIGTNVTYTVLLFLSLKEILRYVRHNSFSDFRPTVQSEFVPGVSLLMPAFSEEATIVESVRSLLKISYGRFEVIVINDGSNDETLVRMTEQFGLHTSKHVYVPTIPTQPVRAIFKSKLPEYANLIVVDKENGGKADALNAGINVARYDLVCAIDADSLLEENALQKVVKPFLEDGRVIASGGIIRIANGCEVSNGRVVKVGLSRNPLPLFQVVEYFRAFLSGRMAWQGMNALLVISGAFGMFRRQVVIDVGGYRTDTVGEDIELVVRMHRIMLERRKPYRIAFVPDPVCWTEVPDYLWILARQRNRWQRGLVDVMRFHGRMLFNQRYGLVGMAAMPYYLFVEILGPVLELLGYVATVILLIRGSVDMEMAALFFLVALLYGILFSVGSVVLEEISFRRYPSPKHLAILLLMGVVENFGYRQLTAWWRLKAIFDSLRGQRGWGKMQRTGFGTSQSGS